MFSTMVSREERLLALFLPRSLSYLHVVAVEPHPGQQPQAYQLV